MAGRHADAVVLSAAGRGFLKSQVRRHKVPRSLSDRYRMVLLCAEGLQSKEVAERLGVHEHTLNTTPKDATHWLIRSMAARTRLSHTTIRRIWTAFDLQPHRSETFKLSSDPLFVDKVHDIVGLYMSPPRSGDRVVRRRKVANPGAGS